MDETRAILPADVELVQLVPLVDVIQIMVAAFPDQEMEGIRRDEYLYAKQDWISSIFLNSHFVCLILIRKLKIKITL